MKKITLSIIMLSVLLLMATQCPPSTKDSKEPNVGGTYKGEYKKGSVTVQLQMELKQDSEKKVTGHVKAKGDTIGKDSLRVADVKGSLKAKGKDTILDCTVTINIPDEDVKKQISNVDELSSEQLKGAIEKAKTTLKAAIPAIMKPGKKEIKVLDAGKKLTFQLNDETTIVFTKN